MNAFSSASVVLIIEYKSARLSYISRSLLLLNNLMASFPSVAGAGEVATGRVGGCETAWGLIIGEWEDKIIKTNPNVEGCDCGGGYCGGAEFYEYC